MAYNDHIAWVAKVFPDWTILEVQEVDHVYAFDRQTGRVYKLPDDRCPFVLMPNPIPYEITVEGAAALGVRE